MRICMLGMYDYLHASWSMYNMEELLESGRGWESGGSSDGNEIANRIPAHEEGEPEHGLAFAGSNAHIEETLANTSAKTKDLTVELLGSKLHRSLRILPFAIEGWEEEPFVDLDPLRYEIRVPRTVPYSVRQEHGAESSAWTDDLKLKIAEDCKTKGTAAFKAGDFSSAAMEYNKALAYVTPIVLTKERGAGLAALRTTLSLNAAAAHLKLGEHQLAMDMLDPVVDDDFLGSSFVFQLSETERLKAMYRLGQAEFGLASTRQPRRR